MRATTPPQTNKSEWNIEIVINYMKKKNKNGVTDVGLKKKGLANLVAIREFQDVAACRRSGLAHYSQPVIR